MALKIVRNDITLMKTDAIVNTANPEVTVGAGCDSAIYKAAGYDKLLNYRKENIGVADEGEVFITPGFDLQAKYIIHAVSPRYKGGGDGEEAKLRSCYVKALNLALQKGIKSIAFPLISTGSFGYPKEEGLRIAADEINAFLQDNKMDVYLVVFDEKATTLGNGLFHNLTEYVNRNYVSKKVEEEYDSVDRMRYPDNFAVNRASAKKESGNSSKKAFMGAGAFGDVGLFRGEQVLKEKTSFIQAEACLAEESVEDDFEFEDYHAGKLEERMRHLTDTFSEYLIFLIEDKKMENADVYKRAIVDKKTFSKIKNNPDYHPQKITALCLCVGAKLNLDETKDLLARAGYALSPCDKSDVIFSYFIENEIYDMIALDIQLEEFGLPCIIS